MQPSSQPQGKRYLYGAADEKFVQQPSRKIRKPPLSSFKFALEKELQGKADFNKFDVPIVFKCSPATLLNLCVQALDVLPLALAYEWSIEDICKWLREKGFKKYQNTFRTNLITGRKLLLVDASALCAMNIKDFHDIKKLAHDIRSLFYYEMTKFARSLSLFPEFHGELYKLVRLKTGAKYNVRRSDVWRTMQLIRQKEPNHKHWEILEQWLDLDTPLQFKELIGGAARTKLYACKTVPISQSVVGKQFHCSCLPPCVCFSDELNYRRPWHLKCLPHLKPDLEFTETCADCCPPCNCRWPAKSYKIHGVLSCLKHSLPNKYDVNFGTLHPQKWDQINFSFFPQI